MNAKQKRIHEEALKRARQFKRAEWPLIEILLLVIEENVVREIQQPNLFTYAYDILGLSGPLSYAFTNVAAKALEIPQLRAALKAQLFSVTKIIRITSVMTRENAGELVEFAKKATNVALDRRRAELNPGKARRTSRKPISKDHSRLSVDVSNETLELLARAKELLSKSEAKSDGDVLNRVLSDWLDRNDPVRRADRAVAKPPKPVSRFCARKNSTGKRVPLTAQERHEVFHRDGGRCVFVNERGERCDHTKWVEVHHIVEVSKGGTNHPSNLRTLCSFHHDLIHQLSFPIEGQFNWIRESRVAYDTEVTASASATLRRKPLCPRLGCRLFSEGVHRSFPDRRY